jgi:hypothetical protein
MKLDPLDFQQVAEIHPDRYQKCDAIESSVVDEGSGEWSVTRTPDADTHHCHLATHGPHYYGGCDCKGYQFNDGPCSHLCLLRRLEAAEYLSLPELRIRSVEGDVVERQQELADSVADPLPATDGGRRR